MLLHLYLSVIILTILCIILELEEIPKPDDAADAICEIEDNIDYSKIYDALDIFVDKNREYFDKCLKKS